MSDFEVNEPILSSPFEEPKQHWWIVEGEVPAKREGRRFANYFYRDPRSATKESAETDVGTMIELKIVTRIRERLLAWRSAGYPGGSRTTLELLAYWSREGRRQPLFFAQREAVEKRWEQSAAYFIDTHDVTQAFVKNAGLGFAIPYIHNGQTHEYLPDFIVKLSGNGDRYLILETKGYDELEDVKRGAAERWVRAVNTEGSFGTWRYAIAKSVAEVPKILSASTGA